MPTAPPSLCTAATGATDAPRPMPQICAPFLFRSQTAPALAPPPAPPRVCPPRSDVPRRRVPRGSCEDGTTCSYFDENPAGGLQSFDSVAWAFVTILQVMTFDTWTDAMFALMNGFSYYAWIYFVAIAVLGGLFVVNLFLCVIFDEFMKSQEAERALSAVLSP